jgi:hypothetical protein
MIKIDDKYAIKDDGVQFTLIETRQTEKGDNIGADYEVPLGYYSTIEGALNAYCRKSVAGKDITSVNEYIEAITSVKEQIREMVRV